MTYEEIVNSSYNLTEREVAAVARQMRSDYRAAVKKMEAELSKLWLEILDGVDESRRYAVAVQYNRLDNLIRAVNSEYMRVARLVSQNANHASLVSISNLYYRQLYVSNFAPGASGLFTVLSPAVIEASVYGTTKVWDELKRAAKERIARTAGSVDEYLPKSGTLIRELTRKRRAGVLSDLETAIRQGIIQGTGFRKTARRVRDILGTDLNNALRIVRTESHRNMLAGNFAMTQSARAEGLDARRQIVSVRDDRARPQSITVNRQMEDDEGYFIYPGGVKVRYPGNSGVARWDINDRESVITIIDGVEPTVERVRNPRTGRTEIISWNGFDEWRRANGIRLNSFGQMVV